MPGLLNLNGPVGSGQPNDPDDVYAFDKALRAIGAYAPPPEYSGEPQHYPTAPMIDALERFQDHEGLKVDRYADPGGTPSERSIGYWENPAAPGCSLNRSTPFLTPWAVALPMSGRMSRAYSVPSARSDICGKIRSIVRMALSMNRQPKGSKYFKKTRASRLMAGSRQTAKPSRRRAQSSANWRVAARMLGESFGCEKTARGMRVRRIATMTKATSF